MIELNDKQIAEFCYLSYTRVDGLWFMKVEERYGFDEALEIDNEVWKVLPKIQARMLKSAGETSVSNGMEALFQCFTTKLTLDSFTYKTEKIGGNDGFRVVITKCPWHEQMVKSGRENLSEKVGTQICNTEYSTWASEFDDNIRFELKDQICKGSEFCVLEFLH